MNIDDLPVLNLDEPINPESGHFEVSEEIEVAKIVRLQDPSGKTRTADIGNPEYIGGMIRFSYRYRRM